MTNPIPDLFFGLSPAWREAAFVLCLILAVLYLWGITQFVGYVFEKGRAYWRLRRRRDAQARVVHQPAAAPVIPMGPSRVRPFSLPAVKGFARLAQQLCEGTSEDCLGWATTTRDTSEGYCAVEHFCAPCAAAYDRWLRNYDGPGDPCEDVIAGGRR